MPEITSKCPTCGSPNPGWHPAVQFEGEVQPCDDPWHGPLIKLGVQKGDEALETARKLERKLHPQCNVLCGNDFGDLPKHSDEHGHAAVEIARAIREAECRGAKRQAEWTIVGVGDRPGFTHFAGRTPGEWHQIETEREALRFALERIQTRVGEWRESPRYHSEARTSGVVRGSSEVWKAAAAELEGLLPKSVRGKPA